MTPASPPDPQRQYARLLGLAARAEKLARRRGHAGLERLEAVEPWLKLVRYCWQHEVPALLLPFRGGALLASTEPAPLLVLGGEAGEWTRGFAVVGLEAGGRLRWEPDRGLQAGLDLFRRLGPRTLAALAWAAVRLPDGTAADLALEEALTLLGLLAGPERTLAETVPAAAWPFLARLWRARGRRLPVPPQLAALPWCGPGRPWVCEGAEAYWPSRPS
ncbi:MAG: hypothetical protein OWV35_08905 [Firmicutes bacterium]|nr:hypothetical protein [Bacillota bacterium]